MTERSCLSKDQMMAYLLKEMNPEQNHAAEKHLSSCEFCREALEGLGIFLENHSPEILETTFNDLNKELKTRIENHAGIPQKPFKPHGNWFFYGMLSLVAVILFVCIWVLFLKLKPEKPILETYPALPETRVKPVQDTSINPISPPESKMVKTAPFRGPKIVNDPVLKKEGLSKETVQKKPDVKVNSNRDREDQKEQVWDEPSPPPDLLETPGEIFTVVEEYPSYPGGDEAQRKFVADNIKYPQAARELGIQGKVFVTFVVETDGTLSDIRVLRGIGGRCNEEAIRVIKAMPKWIPGKQRGQPVKVQYNLPVKFTLP